MTSPYAPTLREPAHRVDPRAKTLWQIGPLLTGIPLTIAAIVLAALVEAARWPAVGAIAVIIVLTVLWVTAVPLWRYRFHRWEVAEEAVYTVSLIHI